MSSTIEILNQMVKYASDRGLTHLYTEDESIQGKTVTINKKEVTNFGSCSYLGLEYNEQLKEGVVDAVTRFGTQFSSSRTYLSIGLYQELESELATIFEKPVIVSASTTLGHLATLPVIVGANDAIVLDMQVHSSIQMTTKLLKAQKIATYVIRHNCMESLERKIQDLNNKYDKIWYLADGVYSMYGDFAPFDELELLLNKYKKFHLYIDDAHGASWAGENGVGVVRSKMKHHDKMVLAISLNKSFAGGGGCMIFPNKEMEQNVRNCGGTYIFSGPIQPPMLGATLASVKLHKSDAIKGFQGQLKGLIDYTNKRLNALSLPQFMQTDSPLFFVPVGLPRITASIVQRMKEDGFYLNSAGFPAVAMKKSGVRFMVNCHMTKKDINDMLLILQSNYLEELLKDGSNCSQVAKIFGIPAFDIQIKGGRKYKTQKEALRIEIGNTISTIDKGQWNPFFAGRGNLNYDNIQLLENTFRNQEKKENNWDFHYFTVTDSQGHVVLKTFYTVVLVKDDMFSPASVSKKVEEMRKEEAYALSSINVITGSMITKGAHVFLDKNHSNWKKALKLLIQEMQATMEKVGATKLMIRDFIGEADKELEREMLELGLINYKLQNNCVINNMAWNNQVEYLAQLGQKYRYNVRKEILKFEDRFVVDCSKPQSKSEVNQCYQLYTAVFDKALELNVFKLPKVYFENMCQAEGYDIIKLYLKPEFVAGATAPVLVGVMFSQVNHKVYNAMIVGLDYQYVQEQNTYKQIMYQTVLRAKALDCQKLDLAYTAELAKKKLGAKIESVCAYVQATDHYNYQILDAM